MLRDLLWALRHPLYAYAQAVHGVPYSSTTNAVPRLVAAEDALAKEVEAHALTRTLLRECHEKVAQFAP